ncbi:hypothetical protein F9L33_10655 [Amylibacter sp. SFDW26]|uniref:hypothetical protein n=1 Tax=Amylibacter sp. SFDW26 TaxID=2652722 RepID=UPI001261E459|nr:hypothetical protein [Amylibacter sp. SFDW26]KAB7613819.1 hypothetical protein F9L33_10655 [Amylibacter sp. SFDW26]
MNDTKLNLNWLRQVVLVLFAFLIIFYQLIPFSLIPGELPAPDIMFCVVCIFIIRRPEIVPFWLIGLIYFAFDIFQSKPFGVWTACILIVTEVLRANRDAFRENLFPFEWITISMVFVLALCANQTFLAMSIVETPPLFILLWELIFTVIAYPIVLFIITYILRVRKPALGEFDIKGQKI